MGQSLTTHVGVGIVLPHPDDEEVPVGLQAMRERYLEEEGEEDYGEFYDHLLNNYPLLELNFGGVSDYFSDYTVMVKSTVSTIWDGSGAVNPSKFVISNDEFDQLAQLISALGFETINPEIVVSASYG